MKHPGFVLLFILAVAEFAAAQLSGTTGDVLGAHLNFGRGCAACHSPHSGAYGNGAAKTAQTTANSYLWGQDTSSLLGRTITFSGGIVETLPASLAAGTPDVSGVLMCLSCHDGNYAEGAMMKGTIFETVPAATYGTYNKIPTLVGNEGDLGAGYLADHPVGLKTVVTCGGTNPQWWDCTQTNGVISMTGPKSAAFVKNYGFFPVLGVYNGNAVVLCTTCHNQHLLNVAPVTKGPTSGLPTGTYRTMFYIRAPRNPASTTPGSNQSAQFCRSCHADKSNEGGGGTATPTIM